MVRPSSARKLHLGLDALLFAEPVVGGGNLDPLKTLQEVVVEQTRAAPLARMLADAVEQVRCNPSVGAGPMEPLGTADPNLPHNRAQAIARASRKHAPGEQERAQGA